MANWYVSSAAYAAIAPWAATTAYTIGQIIRPTAAVAGKKIAYRCTTGGTTTGVEPTWGLALGGTTTNGAVFTAINGDTYGWTGAAGDMSTVTNASTTGFAVLGDKIFLSSDHSETTAGAVSPFSNISGTWGSATTFALSVSRGGSVPPVVGDLAAGATIAGTNVRFDAVGPMFTQGVTFIASAGQIDLSNSAASSHYLLNCSLQLSGVSGSYHITATNVSFVTLDGTSVSFAHAGQGFSFPTQVELRWVNTPSPLAGTALTSLFTGNNLSGVVTCKGVDFSGYTGNLFNSGGLYPAGSKILFDSCKISASATIFAAVSPLNPSPVVELINCWNGTSVLNGRYVTGGAVTTERTITLTGGAADDIGAFSLKMISNSVRVDKWTAPVPTFWFDVENTITGSSKTATIEIVSSASLNNDDIWLQLEYMGTAGNPIASFVDSKPVTPLTSVAAVTTSTAAWNSSPATPVYQHLQVAFTPQRAGRVRGRVMLGKASTTVYVNPNIVIT